MGAVHEIESGTLSFTFLVNADRTVTILGTGACVCGTENTRQLVVRGTMAVGVLRMLNAITMAVDYAGEADVWSGCENTPRLHVIDNDGGL